MKLIELLVQELPKRGGWPEGALNATQDKDGEVCFSDGAIPEFGLAAWTGGGWCGNELHTITASDYDTAIITREQYESALAASKKPAWNGEGLPPAGCECEYISNGVSWGKVKVIGFDGEKIVIRPSGEIYYAITPSDKDVSHHSAQKRKRSVIL